MKRLSKTDIARRVRKRMVDAASDHCWMFTPRVEVIESVYETVFEVLADAMVNGEEVFVRGFGIFESKEQKARVARDINNNLPMRIPARRVPAFKASKTLVRRYKEKEKSNGC